MKNVLSIAAILVSLLLSRVASTQPSDSEARRTAYRAGYAAVQSKNWDEAYGIFGRLWQEAPTYDVALHLGHAEFNLGKYRDAAEHLAFGVAHLPPGEGKSLAEGSRRALERARQEVGTLTLIVDRPGAGVRVDGKATGTTPIDFEIFVDAGAHVIEATLAGYEAATQQFEITRGEQRSIVLKLEPVPAVPVVPLTAVVVPASTGTSPPPHAKPESGPSARTIALLSGAAVTVVAGVTTLVFALNGSAAADRADQARADASKYGPDACLPPALAPADTCLAIKEADDDRVAANRGANISLAVTGVAMLATATMFVVWPQRSSAQTASVRVIPIAGNGAGGLLMQGKF